MKSSSAHSTTAKPGKSLCEGPDIVCKKIGLTPTNIFHTCIARNASGFLNICGGGSAVTIKELVSRIIVASGKSLSVQHDLSMPTISTSLFLDCSKAQRELEWQPRYTLDQGIQKTIQWWRQNIGANTRSDGIVMMRRNCLRYLSGHGIAGSFSCSDSRKAGLQ